MALSFNKQFCQELTARFDAELVSAIFNQAFFKGISENQDYWEQVMGIYPDLDD